MQRRELIVGLGAFAGTLRANPGKSVPFADVRGLLRPAQPSPVSLPSPVAGIHLVDSAIARSATQLAREVSPPYLFNHAVRTFLLGTLTGRALGQKFDDEILYLACILHDLGLTAQFEGNLPFEIQGAEAARHFLEEHAYSAARAQLVWDGIAMHASMIGKFKQPEISLVGTGAGADVLGPDFAQLAKRDVDEIMTAYPRLGFRDAFVKTCADVVRNHPGGANYSFMRDVGERYVPGYRPRNFCDAIVKAPFSD